MQQLSLRQVGVRHVVSDGRNDLGELPEAHLRAYVATLPGSYTVPASDRKLSRNAGLETVRFADAVETRRRTLLSSDPRLSDLEAVRMAIGLVLKENPAMLSSYRADVQEI